MVKKATIRDVAREAGVSVATVSYVLNDRPDQKISAETKKKVLQIANLLQYTPSYAAKQLTTGKSNIIGIQPGGYPVRNTEHADFIECLIACLAKHGYKSMVFPPIEGNNIEQQPNIDGVICVGLTHGQFLALSDSYLIPVVCTDMIVDHYLFFQIYIDFSAVQKKLCRFADYTVLAAPPKNEKYADFMRKTFGGHLVFCEDMPSLQRAVLGGKAPFVPVGDFLTLGTLLFAKQSDVLPVCSPSLGNFPVQPFHLMSFAEKAEKTVQAMFEAMARNPVEHDIPVLV